MKKQPGWFNTFPLLCSLCTSAMLLCGCMMAGPDYQSPESSENIQIHAAEYPETRYVQADLSRWWEVFNDPLLSNLISRAEQNNLDLKIALARVKEARAIVGITSSGLYPVLNADGSIDWGKQSENVNPLATGEQTQYSLTADAGWEIDLFGRIRRSIEAATADYQATWEDHNDILITILAETATTYLQIRTLQA
ncbi:MAG: TolC family protein, partial [Thermodesulfobacteriota bacterium]|nr:TolC family protein [Thermodesulfobacteriota bacterium]